VNVVLKADRASHNVASGLDFASHVNVRNDGQLAVRWFDRH
jgi:hypothetical protein